jgi:hypothetical protein
MKTPPPDFDRDEVLTCMVLAFCIAGALLQIIYATVG